MKRHLFALVLATACSGGSSGPSISNLTYTPTTAPAGVNSSFDMAMDFDSSVDITTI